MKDVEGTVHYLLHLRFRMACGSRPEEVWSSSSFWDQVSCKECLAQRDTVKSWPRASVRRISKRSNSAWHVRIHFDGLWGQEDKAVCFDFDQTEAIKDALWLINKERRKASFNPSYKYKPIHPALLRADRVAYEARRKYGDAGYLSMGISDG